MKQNSLLEARILTRRQISPALVELVFEGRDALPAAEPGSHVDVHLPNGLVRQYSLVDPVQEGGRYRIGVRVMAQGRGGSQSVADDLREGQQVTLGSPRNLFRLEPGSRPIVLIAGGIGITPVHAMAQWLKNSGYQDWTLHYAFSRQDDTYFPSDWLLQDERVKLYEAQPAGDAQPCTLDLGRIVDELVARGGGDVYCCGPSSLMEDLSTRCSQSSSIRYVQEAFEAPEASAGADAESFTVVLAQSGKSFEVPADQSILDTLKANGIEAPHSCGQGICGACETAVLEGTPDHRDAILSPSEQESGDVMMICCSRSRTPTLTLDL